MKARYTSDRGWRMTVANAAATEPDVVSNVMGRAQRVSAVATTTLVNMSADPGAQGELADEAAGLVTVKGVKQYGRKKRGPRGSLIPVALVGSNANGSRWLEWGHGSSIRASRFMSSALRTAAKGGVVYVVRGRRY